MKAFLPMIPFIAAIGLLACQRDDGPVAEGAAAVPDSALASPHDAAQTEALGRAAVPRADDGMGWTSSADGAAVDFGPAGARALLSFACEGQGSARHLVATRRSPAHDGATATLSFTGGGHASSLPMHAVAKAGGPGESEWRGEARGDLGRAVARAFDGEGTVNVTLGGAPALAVPVSPLVRQTLDRCA